MSSRRISGPAIALLASVSCGCAPNLDSQKQASINGAEISTVAGVETRAFATTRTAVLLTGTDEAMDVSVAKNNVQGVFRLHGNVCRTIGGCVAIAVDSRGYWLTARHCLDSGAAMICITSPEGTQAAAPARIVWKSDRPDEDVAILYAPFGDGVVPVDVAREVRLKAEVICVGSGFRSDQLSAGRVIGVGGPVDGSLVWLEHDAPLEVGDSGGPAFYRDGVLAGVNVLLRTSLIGVKARVIAIQPSMDQVNRLIEDDWSKRAVSP